MRVQVIAIVVAAALSAASLTMSLRSSDRDRECNFGRWIYENLAELQETSHNSIRKQKALKKKIESKDEKNTEDPELSKEFLSSMRDEVVEAKFALELFQVGMEESKLSELNAKAELTLVQFRSWEASALDLSDLSISRLITFSVRYIFYLIDFNKSANKFWEAFRSDVADALKQTGGHLRERCLWHPRSSSVTVVVPRHGRQPPIRQ